MTTTCASCGAALSGQYCAQCGEERLFLVAFIVYVLSSQGMGFTLDIGGIKFSIVPTSMPIDRSLAGTVSQIDRRGIVEQTLIERMGPFSSVAPEDVRRLHYRAATVGGPCRGAAALSGLRCRIFATNTGAIPAFRLSLAGHGWR